MSDLTSIIFTMWNQTRLLTKISQSSLSTIRKYTPPEEYELIVIDDIPVCSILDPYSALLTTGPENNKKGLEAPNRTVHQVNTEVDNGYCAAMNQGAKLAKGKYLCFIENDIYFHQNWLRDLRYYLENDICDVIGPWQIPVSYADMEMYRKLDWLHEKVFFKGGWQEQGVMMIRKETFEKTGGWDERFKKIYGWKVFEKKLKSKEVAARVANTAKVHIDHIAGATYWSDNEHNKEKFKAQLNVEGKIIESGKWGEVGVKYE